MKTNSTLLIGRMVNSIKFLSIVFVLFALNNTAMAQYQLQLNNPTSTAPNSIPEASHIVMGTDSPYPSFVRLSPTSRVSERNFMPWLKAAIGLQQDHDFNQLDVQTDDLGFTHYKYIQTYLGVPIDGAVYIIHAKNGYLTSFSGKAVELSGLSAQPRILVDAARTYAFDFVGAEKYAWEDAELENELQEEQQNPEATYYPKGELVWRLKDNTPYLSYKFDIYSLSPDNEQRIYVNATSGAILKTLKLESNCDFTPVNLIYAPASHIFTEKYTANKWRLKDDCLDAKIRVRDWNSNTTTSHAQEIDNTTNTWNNNNNERFGASVLWAIKNAYHYFNTVHGRDSYNNNGGNINGYINAIFDCGDDCTTTNNASMNSNGKLKVGIGNGNLSDSYATLDILAHEYAHAVTSASAGLEYEAESGALNESFSDIFGEIIENWQFGSNDWLMGDQRSSGALRDMSNPKAAGDPDTYLGTNWIAWTDPCNSGNDECGVHTNSGAQNYWFYLICQGGSGTNDNGEPYQVDGIGIEKGRLIAYRTLVSYLGPNSGYGDARENSIQAAIDLFGLCSEEVEAVTDAWHAVGIGEEFLYFSANIASFYNGSNISCQGACDGSIFAFAGGASIIEIDTLFKGLCAGEYEMYAEDINGCKEYATVILTEPDPLAVHIESEFLKNGFQISCFGGSDGGAIAFVTGGTPPYSYLWSTGATTESIHGLPFGVYSVTVTDANECGSAFDIVTLAQPAPLTGFALPVSDFNGYNVSCHNGFDGSAEAFGIGGVLPYHYYWDTPEPQYEKIADNLRAKTYDVHIVDANNCVIIVDVTLSEPTKLTATAAGISDFNGYNISCNGGADGKAEVLPVGGVPPYTYQWDDDIQSITKVAGNLTADTYTAKVTDANACIVNANVTLTEPDPLSIEALGTKTVYYGYPDSACAQLSVANAMGGVPPYQIKWSTGTEGETIMVCPKSTKTYSVTITDKNGCTFSDSVQICVIDVRCGKKLDKITVCHESGGNQQSSVSMCLNLNAVANHLNQGDLLGDCDADRSCSFDNNAKLSIQKAIQENEYYMQAFPNPFMDRFTLHYIPEADYYLSLQLIDMTGKVVDLIFEGNVSEHILYSFEYQTSGIPAGMYFLRLESSTGISVVEKIIHSK